MAGWRIHKGKAVALPIDNIDTDQLIPARFMSAPRAQGYGQYLLYDLRRDVSGALEPDFPLNRQEGASVLIAGRNFGSGSSREAAVYALVDAGIQAVIAPGFGDIFANNAVNNGLLPAVLPEKDVDNLSKLMGRVPGMLTIDLEGQTVALGDMTRQFEIDPSWKMKLLNGWDDIDLTGQHKAAIAAYRNTKIQTAPWAWPEIAD